MRTVRLLSLLSLLQGRGRVTASALAEELDVSVRTVYRDLETLSGAGFPVVSERGPGGGSELLRGYQTRVPGLSGDEAEALGLAGLPGQAAELGFGALLAAGQRKLLAALPPGVRDSAAAAGQRFHLDPADWFRPAPEHPALADIARAVWRDACVRLRYVRGDGNTVERRVEPLGLVLKAAAWYVVGRIDGDLRLYRVSRIELVEPTGETFARDPNFDLAAVWRESSERFERSLPKYPAIIRLSRVGKEHLDLLGDAVERAPAPPASVEEANGWQVMHVTFERLEYALGPLLRMGAEVEVLEPQELRDAVVSTARSILDRYQSA